MNRARLLVAICGVILGALSGTAQAAGGIGSFEVHTSSTQAGAHPDLTTSFVLEDPGQPNAASDIQIDLPGGVSGNPNAITACTAANYASQQCPVDSQVGLVTIHAKFLDDPDALLGTAPLFSVQPGHDQTALFAFIVPKLGIPVTIPLSLRTGSDYGLRLTVAGISEQTPLAAADITVWGFPADPVHDVQRFPVGSPGAPAGCIGLAGTGCLEGPTPTNIPQRPLTQNPSSCTGQPLTATLEITTYQNPAHKLEAAADYPQTTECDVQTFNPVLKGRLTTNEADSASGLDLSLQAKQFLGFSASPSAIRDVTVVFPEGLTINPDAADGQTACPEALARFGTELAAECPDSSKIGNFQIGSPALDGPLLGSIYFGEPLPGDQYRIFMIADGFGIHAKLFGSLRPDPRTGRLEAIFRDFPQVPFESFDLHLFASDRGVVATPARCAVYQVDSTFVPWNTTLAPQNSRPSLGISSGPNGTPCPGVRRPFDPRLVAGTSNPVAGDHSSFILRLDRDDGDQFLGDLNFRMPPGLTGNLRGIGYCPEAAIAAATQNLGRTEQVAPSCPASSQIGTSNVAAGPGFHPFHAVGKMYLAGPFKGAPLSLVAVTPALAGPYDYGVVVVRVAIHVDPLDAHVSAVSDTVPSIIGGVPIRMRSIQVNIDKPDFMINPTNCSAFSVDSEGIGDEGTVANFSSFFHAVNCSKLAFEPRMTIKQLGGRRATSRSRNPSLRFDLRTRPGDANISSLAVTLPRAFSIDQSHLANICSERELAETQCAGRQEIGTATTTTPLLDHPLSGPVYAVSGSGGLPRLAFILDGQVTLVPRASSRATKRGGLRTTVPVVPDAPVGHFRFTLFGGKRGYLVNSRSLCASPVLTRLKFFGQNGKDLTKKVKVKAACGGKGK
jgi:hypothetical protein